MKRLFKFFILLNTTTFLIAVCPDRPTIPTSSITNGLLITPTSEGISNFPTSTAHLSVTIAATPDQECAAGSTYNIIAIGVTPPGSSTQEYFTASIDCDTLKLVLGGDWHSSSSTAAMFVNSFGPFAFFVTFDLDAKTMINSLQTESRSPLTGRQTLTIIDGMSFDENTKIHLCSGKLGISPNACTISEFLLEYRTDGPPPAGAIGHFAGKYPSHAAFYPLTNGPATSLTSYTYSKAQATSGYFGDHPTNPTPGTSPTWDSSNAFVTITKGQFLTFPLPSFLPGLATTSYSLNFAAWVRIRDVSTTSSATVIFSTHLADGASSGYLLSRLNAGGLLMLTFRGNFGALGDPTPFVALDTWQLVGFTVSVRTDLKYTEGIWFSGASSRRYYQTIQTQVYDFSSLAFLRIGGETDSFGGDISIVRLITSGGGLIRSTELCSTLSSIELGTADFAVSCSGANKLSSADGKCYESCPSGTRSATTEAASLCLACLFPCLTCDSTQCTTCEANYYLYQGVCLDSCPDKTYYTGSTCEDCSTGCNTCQSSKCLTCDSNYLFYQGDCLDSCPDKTYLTGSACQDCPTNCKECESSKCSICDENFLFYQGSCLSSCPERTYSTDSICESCPANCRKCDSTGCLACEKTYLLEEGSCLNPCPEKAYYTGSKCQNCSTHCQTCDSTGCLACEKNYFSYEENCIESCPAKTYAHETSCLACSDDHCAECNIDECKACDDGYQLDSNKKCVLPSSPSSPQSSSTSQVEAGLSGGAVAGIVLGGVVATTIAGGAIYVLKFKPTRRSRIFPQKSKEDFNLINSSPNSPTTAIPPIQTCETEGPMLTEV